MSYYNVMVRPGPPGIPELPDTLPPLDLSLLDAYLDKVHAPQPGAGVYPGHGPQIEAEWAAYDASGNAADVFRDGIFYYDFGKNCLEAYHYLVARGRTVGSDPNLLRWLDYASAHANIQVKRLINWGSDANVVYEFPGGLWMAYTEGISPFDDPTPAVNEQLYKDAINGYVLLSGGYLFDKIYVDEWRSREISRLMDFYMDRWRVTTHNDPLYKDINSGSERFYGHRYHYGQLVVRGEGTPGEPGHIWEWMDEWRTPDASYPGPWNHPHQYAINGYNVSGATSVALRNFQAFMNAMTAKTNIRLYNEDANYQQQSRLDETLRLINFDFDYGWFPPNNDNQTENWRGAYSQNYAYCGFNPGGYPEIDFCTITECGGEPDCANKWWGDRHSPQFDTTPLHFLDLAWAYRITGNRKYIDRFDRMYYALFDWTNNEKSWYFGQQPTAQSDPVGGKQYNQSLIELFPGLVLRGDISFKNHVFPDGYPYNTPPQVDP